MKRYGVSEPPGNVRAEGVWAVIFDWAGTVVDYGSLAPVRTLERVFAEAGAPITEAEARADMGLPKREHIARILELPRLRAEWERVRGQAPSEEDTAELYERFVPRQMECLDEYSAVIKGIPEVAERLRERGLKIGSTTGYTRAMLNVLVEKAAAEGFRPDCHLAPEDVGVGRPQPFMIYEAAVRMQIYPLASIVKVGDTVADIEEALNAGAWAVGVVESGNLIGLSESAWAALPGAERAQRVEAAQRRLEQAGAHYTIDGMDELESVLDDIEERLRAGGA